MQLEAMVNPILPVLARMTLEQFCETVRIACLGASAFHPHEIANEVKRRVEEKSNG